MRLIIFVTAAVLIAGCHHRKPAFSDAEMQQIRVDNPGMTNECLEQLKYGGMAAWRPDDPECFEMMPAQRWRGLYKVGFEWANFCPEPAGSCAAFFMHGENWTVWAKGADPRSSGRLDGLYQIEFVGRRTKVAGHFGHLGQYPHMILIDKLISIKEIGAPPNEADAERRADEAVRALESQARENSKRPDRNTATLCADRNEAKRAGTCR